MNLNWSTVFFQIINFLVIVWILKKYLFTPVLSSMEKREKAIQSRLKEAEESRILAEKEKKKLGIKIAEVEKSKSDVISEVLKKSEREQEVLIKALNKELQDKKVAFDKRLVDEREALRSSIKDIAGDVIVNTVSSALTDLANEKIQAVILDNFIEKLGRGELEKSTLLKDFYNKSKHIEVNTSFSIGKTDEVKIKKSLSLLIGKDVSSVDFKIDKSILCGIEVVCDSLLISFGMDTYIKELRTNLDNAIANLTKTQEIIDKEDK